MYASDLAIKLGTTEKVVMDIKHEFHLKTREMIVGRVVEFNFTDEDAEFVKKIFLKRVEEKENAEKLAAQEKEKRFQNNLESIKKEHPLVTDERCFRLSWWPATIPSVLNEADDD